MADQYVAVEVESDAQTLADAAIARLRAQWPGWTPNDGDMEVVQIEALAPMAQNAAETAARVPDAVFRTVGERLHGVPFLTGAKAVGTVTFTIIDSAAHLIPAGTEIDVDGWAFRVNTDTPTSATTVTGVAVTAADEGIGPNDLPGGSVAMLSALAFVASVALSGTTSGGATAETAVDYRDRLSRELELSAKTLVTARDYELIGLSLPGIGRIVAVSNPTTRQVVVTVTNDAGAAVPAALRGTLTAIYDEYRQSTWVHTVQDATYTAVSVIYNVKAYPGYNLADLQTRINAALTDALLPSNWGIPQRGQAGQGGWVAENTVRTNKLIDLIGNVDGVDYVSALTITGADGAGNLLLPGNVALPTPGTINGTVT